MNGQIKQIYERIRRHLPSLKSARQDLIHDGLGNTAETLGGAIEILSEMEHFMPVLDDVLNAAVTTIQGLQAQLKAASAPPAVLGTVDSTTVSDANTLASLVGLGPLDGNPVAPPTPPATS